MFSSHVKKMENKGGFEDDPVTHSQEVNAFP